MGYITSLLSVKLECYINCICVTYKFYGADLPGLCPDCPYDPLPPRRGGRPHPPLASLQQPVQHGPCCPCTRPAARRVTFRLTCRGMAHVAHATHPRALDVIGASYRPSVSDSSSRAGGRGGVG